jgi:transposase
MDPTPSDWRAARRFRAFELKQDGWKQTDIAEALGVSEGAVSQWMKKAREEGKEALKTSPRPGRPPKLSEEERTERLPSLLEKGPEHFRFRGEVWTRKRVRKVIKEKFRTCFASVDDCRFKQRSAGQRLVRRHQSTHKTNPER